MEDATMKIKDMFGVLVSAPILGETLNQIGNSKMPSGLGSATQTIVSAGYLGSISKKFKW